MNLQGYCPMGCGSTLGVVSTPTEVNRIMCTNKDCPNPWAVDQVIANPETEHIVEFEEQHFSVKHPLRERIDDKLFECTLHQDIRDLSGPPVKPGKYRVTWNGDPDWGYEELP
jgi:Family of unknown function (DUF6085)